MSYSSFLCSYGRGSGPIKNDDFSGGSGMGIEKISSDDFKEKEEGMRDLILKLRNN